MEMVLKKRSGMTLEFYSSQFTGVLIIFTCFLVSSIGW